MSAIVKEATSGFPKELLNKVLDFLVIIDILKTKPNIKNLIRILSILRDHYIKANQILVFRDTAKFNQKIEEFNTLISNFQGLYDTLDKLSLTEALTIDIKSKELGTYTKTYFNNKHLFHELFDELMASIGKSGQYIDLIKSKTGTELSNWGSCLMGKYSPFIIDYDVYSEYNSLSIQNRISLKIFITKIFDLTVELQNAKYVDVTVDGNAANIINDAINNAMKKNTKFKDLNKIEKLLRDFATIMNANYGKYYKSFVSTKQKKAIFDNFFQDVLDKSDTEGGAEVAAQVIKALKITKDDAKLNKNIPDDVIKGLDSFLELAEKNLS